MTETLDIAAKSRPEAAAEDPPAVAMVRQAREQGLFVIRTGCSKS